MNKVGLIAGKGRFPVIFAEEARKSGYAVYVAGLQGVTPAELEGIAQEVVYFKLGQISAPIEFFKKNGVSQVAMAGLIKHSSMFSGISPDLKAAKILATISDMRAETIFKAIAAEFAKAGLELISSVAFLPSLLPGPGCLTKLQPDAAQRKNIALGWKVAKTLASVDVGLTVVVGGMAVVAVEAMEGTDACIIRAGEVYNAAANPQAAGLVAVKVARTRQDFRFDLPVIGKTTVESMAKANVKVLAIEAGRTLVLDQRETAALADSAGIAVIAVNDADMQI